MRWLKLHDYIVYDRKEQKVGSVDGIWTESNSGKAEFLGVKTGWVFGKNHITPALDAQIDEMNRCIHLPFLEDEIKEAPTFATDMEINDLQEAAI